MKAEKKGDVTSKKQSKNFLNKFHKNRPEKKPNRGVSHSKASYQHNDSAAKQEPPVCFPEIDELLDVLVQNAGTPLTDFKLSSKNDPTKFFDSLTYEARNAGAVSDMVDQILRHYGLDSTRICTVAVYEESDGLSGGEKQTRGSYTASAVDHGTLRIVIKPTYSEYDTIVAIALHECAHRFNDVHGIHLDDSQKNERLTDLTAIWLGGGNYLKRGYFFRNVRLGYLTEEEFDYALKLIVQKHQQHEKKEREAKEQLDIRRQNLLHQAHQELDVSRQYKRLFEPPQLICEPETVNRIKQFTEVQQARYQALESRCIQVKEMHAKTVASIQALERQLNCIESAVKDLADANNALKPFLTVKLEQEAFSTEIRKYLQGMFSLADSGNPFGMLEKLKFYSMFKSQKEDASLVFHRLERQTDRDSIYALGKCYQKGIFVKQDFGLAAYHLETAASLGSAAAEQELSKLQNLN